MFQKLLTLIAVMVVSGCASNGSKFPTSATLQNQKIFDGAKEYSGMFEKIDGKELTIGPFSTPNKATHYVESGSRELGLKVTYSSNTTEVVWAAKINVNTNLETGEEYKINAKEDEGCISVGVINSKGNVVIETRPIKLLPFLSLNHMNNKRLMNRVNSKMKNAKCAS